jgi:hypothetical protein
MKLDSLEQNWNALGEEDPLWAILSDPGKRGRTWELSEFLATAQPELDDLFAELGARGIGSDVGGRWTLVAGSVG